MTSKKIDSILSEKLEIIKTENLVEEKTQEVFNLIKKILKDLFRNQEGFVFSESENTASINVYDNTIGCLLVDGVALLKDEKIVNKAKIDEIAFKNYKNIVLDNDYNELLTGMIVIYSQTPGTRKVVISRLYVNKEKYIAYKAEVGWNSLDFIKNNFEERLIPIVESSIERALFEGESYWNHNNKVFDNLSELGVQNKIGF